MKDLRPKANGTDALFHLTSSAHARIVALCQHQGVLTRSLGEVISKLEQGVADHERNHYRPLRCMLRAHIWTAIPASVEE